MDFYSWLMFLVILSFFAIPVIFSINFFYVFKKQIKEIENDRKMIDMANDKEIKEEVKKLNKEGWS